MFSAVFALELDQHKSRVGRMAETTDDMVITFLRSAGVDIPVGTSNLGGFETEVLVAACATCLNAIAQQKGEVERLPVKLPRNPGARFRACTALAAAITATGFDGEIGFNQFLYPSEKETRNMLLFLIDQMPKADGDGEGDMGGLSVLSFDEQLRQALVRGLEQPWAPPAWSARKPIEPERASHLRTALAASALAAARKAERQAAAEARLTGGKGGASNAKEGGFGRAEWVWPAVAGISIIGSKGGLVAHAAMFSHESSVATEAVSSEAAATETAAQRAERAERDKLLQVTK